MEELKLKYYIASPGFNETQLKRISQVEKQLKDKKMDFFSPFSHSGKLQLGKDQEINKLAVKILYDENIKEISNSNRMIAIVDDFDKGTAFEVGFFIGLYAEDLALINERLLIIGKNSQEFSKMLTGVIKKWHKGVDKLEGELAIIDTTEKTIDKYIFMGILAANTHPILTYSSSPLETNLMTSCATLCHYEKQGKLDDLSAMAESIEDYDDLIDKFGEELFNLSHLKLAKKIE